MGSNHQDEIQQITYRRPAGGLPPHIICLFLVPHPRDRRACLPISTPYKMQRVLDSNQCIPFEMTDQQSAPLTTQATLYCYPTRIRTSTKRTKISCATVTPQDSLDRPQETYYSLHYPCTLTPWEACVCLVGTIGLEPMNSEERRFTVSGNCRYATFPK